MNVKSLLKVVVRCISTFIVAPVIVMHYSMACFIGKDRALTGSSQLMSLIPGLTGDYLRRVFLSWTVKHCHPSASIGFCTFFSKTDLIIGENVYIGPFCSFGNVVIGRDSLIATGVHIPSGGQMHGFADVTKPIRLQPGIFAKVTIGEDCWIGNGAIIMADVGAHSVIAAGAVVTKALPEFSVAGGVPAKLIRSRLTALSDQS